MRSQRGASGRAAVSWICAALAASGCSSASSGGNNQAPATSAVAGGVDASSSAPPPSDAGTCVGDGETYECLGISWPACPAIPDSGVCAAAMPPCIACYGNAGFSCACVGTGEPADDAGGTEAGGLEAGSPLAWQCVATGYGCR